jgi:anthranilate phosphoribosyltransferase
LERVGIAFLFAPHHHPAMRHVGPARKALGIRTVFNQLGPLANPAGAKRQLIGVYERNLVLPMANALRLLGAERAIVAHGADGLDEISPCGPTWVAELRGGEVSEFEWSPSDFGLEALPWSALAAGVSAEQNAAILREALSDLTSPRSHALLPNAAAALYLAGNASDLKQGAEMARQVIQERKAIAKLEAWIEGGRAK